MMPANIPGANGRIGKSQGYTPLLVRKEIYEDGSATMTSAWEPTPAEIVALMGGATVHVTVIGGQPPMKVTVGDMPDAQEPRP